MSSVNPLPASLFLRTLSGLFRLIPPGTRGKGRLARMILPVAVRSNPTVIQNTGRNKMIVPNLLEPVGMSLWMDGLYEPETLQFLRSHIRSDSVFVDVGANIGAFTISLAASAQHVIAIEPSPQVLPYLRRNVEINEISNIDVVACAASTPDRDSVPLYVPPESHFGMASSAPQFGATPVTIPARSLDSILKEYKIESVSAMKVDTEGYEAHVFLGAEDLLRSASAPAVIFEFCDWAEERAFPGRKGWAQRVLMDFGYDLWDLRDYGSSRASLDEPITEGSHSIVGIPSKKRS